ncbi:hypothetical protein NP493_98g05014 [Ridgeia piscesae]|uniref:Uncharacterized protein n=1 Tax=Ridgeia piscesae TaxID=27915 RepID=A0AAD9P7T5_RIDPI|nr:hypothetical protein NP493_98g05014 [Ridgeia piscesae]
MMENDTPICVKNTQIKNVESYVYMGQRYSTRDQNQDKEIQRRITAGLTAFAKHRDIFDGNIETCLTTLQVMRTSSNDIRRVTCILYNAHRGTWQMCLVEPAELCTSYNILCSASASLSFQLCM